MNQQLSKWLVPLTPSHEADSKLFCFPYAGGGAAVYRPWGKLLPQHLQAFAVQPPGRETRFSEAPLKTLADYAAQASMAIRQACATSTKIILFGHSLGAIAAYETAKCLAQTGPSVSLLMVSGRQDPTTMSRRLPISHLTDAEFVRQMATYNGTPAAILANKELLDILLPMIKADFAMAEHYRLAKIDRLLTCPVVALASRQDEWLSESAVQGWAHVTEKHFELKWFEGDHFYLNQQAGKVVDFALEKIAETTAVKS